MLGLNREHGQAAEGMSETEAVTETPFSEATTTAD